MSSEFYCERETVKAFECACSEQCSLCERLEATARAAKDPCEFLVNVEASE